MDHHLLPSLLGCGILAREVRYLAHKNGWKLNMQFACSSLHVDYDKLRRAVEKMVEQHLDQPKVVMYGACHPLMDRFLKDTGCERTPVQNCIELLLGPSTFHELLADGAFFLLEDWARRWLTITAGVFGANQATFGELFRDSHRYVLALETPCSDDFTRAAEEIAHNLEMPLRWQTVNLTNMEKVLLETMSKLESNH